MTSDDRDNHQQASRREFCAHACRAVSLATFAPLLQGCGGGGSPTSPSSSTPLSTVNGTVASGTVTVTVDTGPLASVGSMALVQSPSGNFLVVRTAQEAFTALTAVCTHENCTITGFSGQIFVCPCHGSQYNTGGGVVNGPATRALRQYTTRVSGNVLSITL